MSLTPAQVPLSPPARFGEALSRFSSAYLNALIWGKGRVAEAAFTEAVLCGAGERERCAAEKAQAIIAGQLGLKAFGFIAGFYPRLNLT